MAQCLLGEFGSGLHVNIITDGFFLLYLCPSIPLVPCLLHSLLSLPFHAPPLASLLLLNESPSLSFPCLFTEDDEERSSSPHPQCPEGFLRKWADQVVHV